MDVREFLGLQPTHNPNRWFLPIELGICGGSGSLYGGCGLAAAIVAMEAAAERPLVWANCQYLAHARPPAIMDLDVTLAVVGNAATQARVIGRVGDQEVLHAHGTLGQRELPLSGAWIGMPDVAPPADCKPRSMPHHIPGTLSSRLEQRVAEGEGLHLDIDDGRSALWCRLRDGSGWTLSAATLGILGDFVPSGVGLALGELTAGASLDNTIRVANLVETEWVLCDIRVDAVANGFGHGMVYLWAEDGSLLAMASQSIMVKLRD
ncbi:MAG: acyl-CoA thioesterase [Acidimicrobiales bacterium]